MTLGKAYFSEPQFPHVNNEVPQLYELIDSPLTPSALSPYVSRYIWAMYPA